MGVAKRGREQKIRKNIQGKKNFSLRARNLFSELLSCGTFFMSIFSDQIRKMNQKLYYLLEWKKNISGNADVC